MIKTEQKRKVCSYAFFDFILFLVILTFCVIGFIMLFNGIMSIHI